MVTVARAVSAMTVRTVRMPRGTSLWAPPKAANAEGEIVDGYRYQAIGSLQAFGIAAAASLVLTGLLWIAL